MKVFISHSHKDSEFAKELAENLREIGYSTFTSSEDVDVEPGKNWHRLVAEAIEQSQAMVIVLSKSSSDAPWVNREIDYALTSLNYKNRLITVVLDKDAEIPWILRRFPFIEAKRSESDRAIKQVVKELREVAA